MNLDIDRLNDPAALWAADTVYRPDLFAGKVALVSGAGSGLGRACALLFARLGARLVICGRTPEKLEAVAEFVRDKGGEVLVVPTNVREPDQVDALFAQAHAHYGRIDCTVNNAGGQFPQAAIDFAPKGWSAVINNNLNGTWLMMQRAAQYWRDLGPVAEPMLRSICNIVVVIERFRPPASASPFWPGNPRCCSSSSSPCPRRFSPRAPLSPPYSTCTPPSPPPSAAARALAQFAVPP